MRPLTDTTPKPLLEVGGKPLLVWHIERLVKAGITDLLINHAWLGDQIELALGDGRKYGARIRYSAEKQALETAGGIAYGLDFFEEKPFVVVNGDVWCDWRADQAQSVADRLIENDKLAWLLLVDNPAHHPQGDFQLDAAGAVRDKTADGHSSSLTFSGIAIYRPELFVDTVRGEAAPLAPLLRKAMNEAKVAGDYYEGRWVDVGTPERLERLDQQLRNSD